MSGSFEHMRSPLGSIIAGLVVGVSLIVLHIAIGGPGAFTPSNGWGTIKRVGGTVGMGFSGADSNPGSTLSIKGNASVGAGFVDQRTSENSLVVEGNVGVGTTNPLGRLEIDGGGIILNGIPQRGFPNERVPQGNLVTDTTSQNPAASTPLSIAIGKDGLPLIAYIDSKSTVSQGDDTLNVWRCADIQCQTFLPGDPVVLTNAPVGRFVNLIVKENENPVIVYQESDAGGSEADVIFARCTDSRCSSILGKVPIDQNIPYANVYPAVATATDGSTLIAYLFSGDMIRIATCAVGCSVLNDIVNPILGFSGHTTITVGVDGFPAVTAISRNSPRRIHFVHCKSVDCTSYDAPILIDTASGSGDVGKYASMSVGADGLAVISYYDEDNTEMKVLKCQTVKCDVNASVVIDSSPETPDAFTSLTIGGDGYPVVAYSYVVGVVGGTWKTKIAKCGSASCSDGIGNPLLSMDASPLDSEAGEFISVTIGADGLPITAYTRYTGVVTPRVRIIHCGSTNCVPYWTRR